MKQFFPGLSEKDLPDEEAWAVEHVELSTHNGTHLDAPYHYASTMDNPEIIWEGHKAGRECGYCHLEKLANLENLPSHGFLVSCFPIKIKAVSTVWTRAVAFVS